MNLIVLLETDLTLAVGPLPNLPRSATLIGYLFSPVSVLVIPRFNPLYSTVSSVGAGEPSLTGLIQSLVVKIFFSIIFFVE